MEVLFLPFAIWKYLERVYHYKILPELAGLLAMIFPKPNPCYVVLEFSLLWFTISWIHRGCSALVLVPFT